MSQHVRLLLITDLELCPQGPTVERVRLLCGHPRVHELAVGVRDHARSGRERLHFTRELLQARGSAGLVVLVHDRLDVALAAGADGVQLGERSVGVAEARALLPPGRLIGRSCHDRAGILEAVRERADLVTVSPVAASPGKGRPLGVDGFAALAGDCADLGVLALGGVDAALAAEVAMRGATGVAVVRAWLTANEPLQAVDALLAPFVS